MPSPRDDRGRFLAYGLTTTLNALALLLVAFQYSFRFDASRVVWTALGLSGLCLLLATWRAIRRGRDLGWSPWLVLLGFPLSLALAPLGWVLPGALCLGLSQPAADRCGAPATPLGAAVLWRGAVLSLLWPWTLMVPMALTV